MNACAILVLPHSFNVQALSSKTPARVFVRLSRKFFGNDEFVNETPAGFLLGVAENFGEFPIDLQDSVICVEQDDRFWHSREQPIEEGCKRVQRNVVAFASFPHSENCSATCKENNSGQQMANL